MYIIKTNAVYLQKLKYYADGTIVQHWTKSLSEAKKFTSSEDAEKTLELIGIAEIVKAV